jgi:hypothetical protein
MALAFYWGGAELRVQMRNSFGVLSAPVRIATFGSVSVTLWLVAFTVVSRVAARLHYALDPAYESQRKKKRWVQQLGIGDRLRVTDCDKATYCTISRIDSEQGETFEVTWSDGCKNTLSYCDADLFEEIALGDAGRAARRV